MAVAISFGFLPGFQGKISYVARKSPTFRLKSLKPGSIGHWNFADGSPEPSLRRLSCRYTIRADGTINHALARVPQRFHCCTGE